MARPQTKFPFTLVQQSVAVTTPSSTAGTGTFPPGPNGADLQRGAPGADALEGSVLPVHVPLHLLPLLRCLRSPLLDLLLHLPLLILWETQTRKSAPNARYMPSASRGRAPTFPSQPRLRRTPRPARRPRVYPKHATVAVGDLQTFVPCAPVVPDPGEPEPATLPITRHRLKA